MPFSTSPRVFLADDSDLIRSRVSALLTENSMQVVGEATTPARCISGILTSGAQVVVLDAQLDGGSGLEVLRAVRQVDPDIAFVVFSNNSAPAYRKRYLGEGAASFLDKSCDFEQLPTAINAASSVAH